MEREEILISKDKLRPGDPERYFTLPEIQRVATAAKFESKGAVILSSEGRVRMMKMVNLQATLEQLAESLRLLSTEELEELELLLIKDEVEKRSEEIKRSSLSLDELESLADV